MEFTDEQLEYIRDNLDEVVGQDILIEHVFENCNDGQQFYDYIQPYEDSTIECYVDSLDSSQIIQWIECWSLETEVLDHFGWIGELDSDVAYECLVDSLSYSDIYNRLVMECSNLNHLTLVFDAYVNQISSKYKVDEYIQKELSNLLDAIDAWEEES